ncbi:MAG: hypothetical protein D6679_05115 [Candidatus Hydrogenedentota bacterium]|nr:MAG: hypothetical protein D6679_05115 [Candidatus Hydrogenedentota bacterium]
MTRSASSGSFLFPLLPLPNFVLFPGTFLPLNIFESRLRALVTEATLDEGLLVQALLRPGWETDYHRYPAVHNVACLARIVTVERIADGRLNILLEGIDRVEILDEVRDRLFRRAVVRLLPRRSRPAPIQRRRLFALLEAIFTVAGKNLPPDLFERLETISNDDLLADTLAHILHISPEEKQELLEMDSAGSRLNSVCNNILQIIRRSTSGRGTDTKEFPE